MKTLALVIALTFAAPAISLGQDATPPPEAREKSTSPPNPPGVEHPQHETGTTGWTGGNRGAGTTTTGQGTASDPAADQPEMATGADLKGPPKRFPPSETPE